MRRILPPLWGLVALTLAGIAPAAAGDADRAQTIEGLVRTVGAQAGIVLYCRAFYTVDDRISEGLSLTVRRALDKALGHRQAEAAIAEEGRRVGREIETVGAERWCADQRDILNTDGIRVFVD